MKKKSTFITAGIILVGLVIITFAGKDLIAQRFPTFGSLLQSGFGINAKNQEAELAVKQAETLQEANDAIAAAEKLSAETIAPESPPPSPKDPLPWTFNSGDSGVTPTLTLNPKVKVYSAVTVDPHPDHLPVEGEQIVLPMLNGKSIKVNVESAESNDNGDYIWSGHLDGHNNDYPIVMTYGENTTFATITTPDGSYSLEAVKGVGWLYKNPAEAELTAQGKNDYLIPDE